MSHDVNHSDIDIIHVHGIWECLCCKLVEDPHESMSLEDFDDLMDHINLHIRAGHKIPITDMEEIINDFERSQYPPAPDLNDWERLVVGFAAPRYTMEFLAETCRNLESMQASMELVEEIDWHDVWHWDDDD